VEGEELTKGRNVQLLAVQVYSQCGARGVRGARGAVFRDIGKLVIETGLSSRPLSSYIRQLPPFQV